LDSAGHSTRYGITLAGNLVVSSVQEYIAMPLYFNAQVLPEPTNEYVAWIDVMGIQSAMSRSLDITANFVFKLHVAALQAPHDQICLYPVMDGLYLASGNQQAIFDFLRSVFYNIADTFVHEAENLHRFVVRGALAFGPVIHGSAVPPSASNVFVTQAGGQYKNQILLGMPMVQSHLGEKNAPPFELFVHESARTFAPPAPTQPLHHVWWKWGNPETTPVWNALPEALDAYFKWCRDRASTVLYDRDRIQVHSELAQQYFR
jgi:hypothetical protein